MLDTAAPSCWSQPEPGQMWKQLPRASPAAGRLWVGSVCEAGFRSPLLTAAQPWSRSPLRQEPVLLWALCLSVCERLCVRG